MNGVTRTLGRGDSRVGRPRRIHVLLRHRTHQYPPERAAGLLPPVAWGQSFVGRPGLNVAQTVERPIPQALSAGEPRSGGVLRPSHSPPGIASFHGPPVSTASAWSRYSLQGSLGNRRRRRFCLPCRTSRFESLPQPLRRSASAGLFVGAVGRGVCVAGQPLGTWRPMSCGSGSEQASLQAFPDDSNH